MTETDTQSLIRIFALERVMTECDAIGMFARGRARSPSYKENVRATVAHMYDRIHGGLVMRGEVQEQFSTARGLGRVIGLGKSAAYEITQRLKDFEVFEHNPILRRWQTNRPSPTAGSNSFWWMPTVWRTGLRFRNVIDFVLGSCGSGTKLAVSPLGSQYRTTNQTQVSGYSSEIDVSHSKDLRFPNGAQTRPVLAPSLPWRIGIDAINRLQTRLAAEGERAVTIPEATEALRMAERAVEGLGRPSSRVDHERLQQARQALDQATEFMVLAEIADRSRSRPG